MAKKSRFELSVVERVKELRLKKKFSQDDVAAFLNVTRGFVGQIESPNSASKYNFNHLNTLAREFGCSPREFLPEKPL